MTVQISSPLICFSLSDYGQMKSLHPLLLSRDLESSERFEGISTEWKDRILKIISKSTQISLPSSCSSLSDYVQMKSLYVVLLSQDVVEPSKCFEEISTERKDRILKIISKSINFEGAFPSQEPGFSPMSTTVIRDAIKVITKEDFFLLKEMNEKDMLNSKVEIISKIFFKNCDIRVLDFFEDGKEDFMVFLRFMGLIFANEVLISWGIEGKERYLEPTKRFSLALNNSRSFTSPVEIDLSSFGLESLPKIWELSDFFDNLYKLDLSKNSLKFIPKEFSKLKNLKILNMSSNRIETLPEDLGYLSNLEVFLVGDNPLIKPPKKHLGRFLVLDKKLLPSKVMYYSDVGKKSMSRVEMTLFLENLEKVGKYFPLIAKICLIGIRSIKDVVSLTVDEVNFKLRKIVPQAGSDVIHFQSKTENAVLEELASYIRKRNRRDLIFVSREGTPLMSWNVRKTFVAAYEAIFSNDEKREVKGGRISNFMQNTALKLKEEDGYVL